MAKDCPECGLASTDTALRCDCGYDFSDRTMKESYLSPQEQRVRAALTSADVAICVLVPAVGIIMGVNRLRQQRPRARKMLLWSGGMLIAQIAIRLLTWKFS
jgi:hypothetical protein